MTPCYQAVTVQANYNTCSNILLRFACSDITALVTAILQRIITGKNRGHEAIVVFLKLSTTLLLYITALF